jgi:hypothetical protein
VPVYSIPFRCLYSANVDNLLFAGRDMSVTHIALGSVRVQGTLSALGQAAGTAAAMCCRQRMSPRQLVLERLDLLQQTLLKYDQYIPGLKNADPLDLARRAHLTATSTARYEEFGRPQVHSEQGHPLNMSRAVLFPRGVKERLGSVFLRLTSQRPEPVPISMHVRGAPAAGDFSAAVDLATATAVVPPQKTSYVEFHVDCAVPSRYVWIWLPRTEGVTWSLMSSAPLDSCRAYGGGPGKPWTTVNGQFYAFCTSPPLIYETDYRAENVTSGIGRIVGRASNLWASDAAEPLPQSIELAFDSPMQLGTVYLTFDTDLNAPFHTVPRVFQCVRDYRLSYNDGSRWIDLVSVTDNFQRRRVHHFPRVTAAKLRLTVLATHGDRSARVFGIRAYEE